MREIVIAAYDRNLDWTSQINNDVKLTIYRKGEAERNKEIKLDPNIGRDVHTFFNHIYSKYDSLSDYTFFCQDYPFDHWGNILEIVNGNSNDIPRKCSLNIDNGYYGFHNNTFNTSWSMHKSQHVGMGSVISCQKNGLPQDTNPNIDLDKYWELLFESKKPPMYEFIPGGHFVITKKHAQLRSKSFYKNICQILLEDQFAPWIIERLECYIFNSKFKSKIC